MTVSGQQALPLGGVGRAKDERGGPVYQGVCKQIRALFPVGPEAGHKARCKCESCESTTASKDAVAGWIAQARSLAASIDRVSGAAGTRQASGVQLAALHERLDEILARLSPEAGGDGWDKWLQDLDEDEEQAGGRAAQPHREG